VAVAAKKDPEKPVKPVRWLGDSRRRLRNFPEDVKDDVGAALFWAQTGTKHPSAKPLLGFGGAHTLEIVENDHGNTYRVVYTVRYSARIYVLHCFQKKSKTGDKTPQHEIDLVRERLKQAEKMESNERAQIAKS
jgi:phage-related protein